MALETYNFDPTHSTVGFTVRHMVVSKVRGRFAKWGGTLAFDDQDPSRSQVSVSIDAASIDTGVADRDAHLRSADFLDVEKFPTLTFQSKSVTKSGADELAVAGDLTLHGVTRPVTLEVSWGALGRDPWGNQRYGFSARTAIDRKEFGLRWNQALETGGVLVSEKVEIELELQALKAIAKAA
jgi:polyisoprenoid-binding protein YceI